MALTLAVRRKLQPTEHMDQCAVVLWARTHANPDIQQVHATPNESRVAGRQGFLRMQRLKAEGLAPGFPDLGWAAARGGFTGLHVELKREIGGKVSETQQDWIDYLRSVGRCVFVAEGAEQARKYVESYFGWPATVFSAPE